jgi:glycyl-tRNA synthetase beta subunit
VQQGAVRGDKVRRDARAHEVGDKDRRGDLGGDEALRQRLEDPRCRLATVVAADDAHLLAAAALQQEDFAGAMKALSGLREPVDAFFEKVLVNSDVASERDNRLRLLGQVRRAMGRVADFGEVNG